MTLKEAMIYRGENESTLALIPESAVQRFQPRMDLSERGEDLLW